ncbi:E3 ubiquitin-protein ligase RBBP6-like [Diachasmimorpha longicaudata]|uniref:E3 ubiquitin-protein ligase RBBP6-like n=1 Tax=Diachasmimorpha longicaudata TaxID=58733 RepID=UPI0030B914B0
MPKEECFICATDEGLLLDVLAQGKDIRDVIQNYLSLEVQKRKAPASRICYKCAYELTECNKFIGKFNQVHDNQSNKKSPQRRGHCNLCSEPGKKGFIYDLQNEALNNVFIQIQDLFGRDLSSTSRSFLVCLYCRYHLDVLSDLKKVAKHKSPGGDTFSGVQKVSVNVIRRKTTSVPLPIVTNSTSPTRSTRRTSQLNRSSSPTERQCDKCAVKIDNGIDMYRFHTTGEKLCKDCWISMDPAKQSKGRQRNTPVQSNTKLCTVVLKDVLTNPPEGKNQSEINSLNSSKAGAVRTRNAVYIISDDSDDGRAVKKLPKRSSSENDTQSTKKPKRDEFISQRQTRASSVMNSVVSSSRNVSKSLPKRRHSDCFEVPDTMPKRQRGRPRRFTSYLQEEEVDDKKATKTPAKVKAVVTPTSKTSKKPSPPKSVSSNEEVSKKTPEKNSSQENEITKAEEWVRRSTRVRKSPKHWSETSESPGVSEEDNETVEGDIESGKPLTRNSKVKGSTSRSKNSQKEVEAVDEVTTPENDKSIIGDGENQSYTCTICCCEFENKIEGMTHELNHSKKLGVVLEKVVVSGAVDDGNKEVDNEESISAEVEERKTGEDSLEAVEVSEVTEDAGTSQKDDKSHDNNEETKEDEIVEVPGESGDSEKPTEAEKVPEGDGESAEGKNSEGGETESDKLPGVDESNGSDGASRPEVEETKNDSGDDGKADVDDAGEGEKENADEESLVIEKEVVSEDKTGESELQKIENGDQEGEAEVQSVVASEETNEDPQREDVLPLTNGKNEDPPAEGDHEGEEKTMEKVSQSDESPVDENAKSKDPSEGGDEEKIDDEEAAGESMEQPQKVGVVEKNDEDEREEERATSPPGQEDVVNGEEENDATTEDSKSKGGEIASTDGVDSDDNNKEKENVNEVTCTPDGERVEEAGDYPGDAGDAEPFAEIGNKQLVDVDVDADEASMDAIERQMESIVGKDVTGGTNGAPPEEQKVS